MGKGLKIKFILKRTGGILLILSLFIVVMFYYGQHGIGNEVSDGIRICREIYHRIFAKFTSSKMMAIALCCVIAVIVIFTLIVLIGLDKLSGLGAITFCLFGLSFIAIVAKNKSLQYYWTHPINGDGGLHGKLFVIGMYLMCIGSFLYTFISASYVREAAKNVVVNNEPEKAQQAQEQPKERKPAVQVNGSLTLGNEIQILAYSHEAYAIVSEVDGEKINVVVQDDNNEEAPEEVEEQVEEQEEVEETPVEDNEEVIEENAEEVVEEEQVEEEAAPEEEFEDEAPVEEELAPEEEFEDETPVEEELAPEEVFEDEAPIEEETVEEEVFEDETPIEEETIEEEAAPEEEELEVFEDEAPVDEPEEVFEDETPVEEISPEEEPVSEFRFDVPSNREDNEEEVEVEEEKEDRVIFFKEEEAEETEDDEEAAEDEEDEDDEIEDEDDSANGDDVLTGAKLVINAKKSNFDEKVLNASDEVKERYNQIKNVIMSYKNVRTRLSRTGDSFRYRGQKYVYMNIVGKTLRVYLALDPTCIDSSVYHQVDVSNKKKYQSTPTLLRVKSNLSVKKTIKLIEAMFDGEMIEKRKKYEEQDYAKELCDVAQSRVDASESEGSEEQN